MKRSRPPFMVITSRFRGNVGIGERRERIDEW